MYETGCKDNTDSSCYCKDSQFITHVMGCISAWSTSPADASAASSYLMGICAAHIPNNPAIITACPTPPMAPAPSSSDVAPVTTAPVAPVTDSITSTSTYYSTLDVTITSCAASINGCPGSSSAAAAAAATPAPTSGPAVPLTTITYSSGTLTTTVTVPQVLFTTSTIVLSLIHI